MKMWSRVTFFVLFYLATVNCAFQTDKLFGQIKNFGSRSEGENERNQQHNEEIQHQEGRSQRQSFGNSQNSGFNDNVRSTTSRYNREGSSGREDYNRPTEFGQTSMNNNNSPSTGFDTINREHSYTRPTGESTYTSGDRENRPPSFSPSSSGDNSFGRPTGGSTHTNNREGDTRPSSFSPSNSGDNSFGRPTGGSSFTSNNREGDSRPSSFSPSSSGDNSFGRPTGGSSFTSNNRETDNRPSNFRPSNSGDNSITRPTGEFTHTTSNYKPTSEGEFGQSGHNQQTGHRPENTFGGETHRPSSGHHEPTNGQNYPESNGQTDNLNQNETQGNHKGKEDEKDVCFNHVGCFKMGMPWKSVLRPVGTPYSPERIETTIHFYSRENLEKQINITVYPEINMRGARFDPNKISAIIVHGFSNSGNATWMKDMKNVYLKKVDANVMIVDWGRGAQLMNYLQVAGNTRVVGKQLGLFVKHLINNFGADPGKFHLIGHSLGAQICSYLAKEVPGIARLTALDPAQPGFEGFNAEVRLDKTDAEFVDVVHTDARPFIPTLGFGMITPHGHVDFYMNGGYDQPGCIPPPKKELPSIKSFLDLAKYPVEVISKMVSCPHGRAYEYLIEAFNETDNCIFWGHKADAKNIIKSVSNTVTQGLLKKITALSTTCSKEDCIPLGFATKKSPLRGVFVVTTNNRMPYCISEPGVPPESPPQERNQESYIQKIGRKTGITG